MPVFPQTDAHLRQPYPTAGAEPLLAFVWQPKDLRPDVVTLARQAATRAVFDLTAAPPRSFAASLRDAGATEVKVWAESLLDPGLKDFLELSGVETLWAEYHPALFSSSLDDFLARLAALGNACTCIPVTGDLAALLRLARGEGNVPALALKGSEAAGLVGSETAGILYATREAERQRLGSGPRDVLSGGLATPEAAAAFLTSGAGSEPPDGRSKWTVRLLADRLVEMEAVDSISHMSVQRLLKKMKLSLG